MKIAIASSGLGLVSRGIETWAEDTAEGLNRKTTTEGLSVTLFKGGGFKRKNYEKVLACAGRGSAANRFLTSLFSRLGGWRYGFGSDYQTEQTTFARRLLPELRRGGFDIVHVQDPWLGWLLQKAREDGCQPAKVILAHATEEPAEFLEKFRYIQHLAPFHMQEAAAGRRGKGGVWTAIPNLVDTQKYRPGKNSELRVRLKIPEKAFVVLAVAAMKKDHKRVDYLISEMVRIKDDDVYLLVAGARTEDADEIIRIGTDLLGARAKFLPDTQRDEMCGLYRAADLFVLCSLKEMLPIAMLEAMASGLPVLTHRYPVMEWMMGGGGRAIDMSAPGELAQAVQEFRGNSDLKKRSAAGARDQTVKIFSEEIVIDQFIEMYRRVMVNCGSS